MNPTSSSAPKTINIVRVKNKAQKVKSKNTIRIYNHSEKDIFLIPILNDATADPRRTGLLDKGKATILAEDSIEVNLGHYGRTDSNFRTDILFRAADDDIQKVLDDFLINGSEDEKLYSPKNLKGRELHLRYDEANIVKDGQMRDLITDIRAKQEKLKKDVEDLIMDKTKQGKLKEDVNVLLMKMDDLLKCCHPPLANLDRSFFTNTPSSSK